MSSTDSKIPDDPASPASRSSNPWTWLGAIVVVCALAGVLAAWALPSLLSSFQWPKIVSKAWIGRLVHPPQPTVEPLPRVEDTVVQPVQASDPVKDSSPQDPIDKADEPPPKNVAASGSDRPNVEKTQPTTKPRPAPKRVEEPAEEQPRDVTYKVDRRAIAKIIRSPTDLGRHGRFVPNIVDGQRRGFKFVDVAGGGLFDRLGVRTGDVILKVNGRTLTTQSKLIEDLKVLKSAHVYVVHIQRDDTERIHRYDAGPPLKRKAGAAADAQ